MTRVAEHVFQDEKCLHCGVPSSESQKSCVFRDAPPRAVPVSVFADLGAIGDRMKVIMSEEGKPA